MGLAGAAVGAGAVSARVHLNLTEPACKTRLTEALKVINLVHTRSSIPAGLEQAIVVVVLAVFARESFTALARVGVAVLVTDAGMLARVGSTLVFLQFTASSLIAGSALADKAVEAVLTGPSILARVTGAGIRV